MMRSQTKKSLTFSLIYDIIRYKEKEGIVSAAESIMMLMGPEVEGRREFLFENVDFSILNR